VPWYLVKYKIRVRAMVLRHKDICLAFTMGDNKTSNFNLRAFGPKSFTTVTSDL